MTLLLDIAPFIAPANPQSTGAEIYRRFQAEPETLAIAVVDDAHKPVGIIERNAFLVRMAAEYGHALWSKRPVASWMKTDPVTADGAVSVAEFCGRVLAESPSQLLHGFIVTTGGRYAGVGTTLALLQASAAATETHAQAMTGLAEEARAASREAQEALAAKARFLAVMSHEIRTPLNGVLAVAEIVRRKVRQPDLMPFVETILESGGVLLRLLNDALDLSRAEASDLALDEQPVRVSGILEAAAGLWSAQAELRGLSLTMTYEGDDLWVLADGLRLRQILNNLVSNAMKFAGQGRVDICLAARTDGAGVRFTGQVIDTGPGLPIDKLESIFAPFQQTDEGLRLGGAGLGLAVCRQIIERMGGRIWARNGDAGGAVFSFEMALEAVSPPLATTSGVAPAEVSLGAMHVLVADDNATNRLVTASLCEIFGLSCECVNDGAEAVAAAASGRFDLILMDIKMPVMDGVEATRIIRSGAGAVSQIPIVALTANADPSDAAFYRMCGMNGVVEKPINPERLLNAMSAVLQLDARAA